jgi:hypothetical protein
MSMSLSSMAQDSALRLGRPSLTPDQLAQRAAVAAAAAVSEGKSADDAARRGVEAAKAATSTTASVPSGPLNEIVKYVPTETVTLYIALQAALGNLSIPSSGRLSDADFTSRWIWLWVMLAVTVLLALGLSYRSQRDANKDFKVPLFEMFASAAAFLVWAFSLPSTPLRDIDGYDYNAWNSFIILAGTVAIAVVAYILGKSVSWQKVVDTEAGAA